MKFFSLITIISAFLLFSQSQLKTKSPIPKQPLPKILLNQKSSFKDSFKKPQNANMAWALTTGERSGISPKVLLAMKELEIGFLMSPSGIHLSAISLLLLFIFKRFLPKKAFKITRAIFLSFAFFLPFLAIKRLVIMRLIYILPFKKLSIISIFISTFFISFVLGHYTQSPMSFTLSFLFIGTFISLRDHSKIVNLLGLSSSHLLIAFFNGNDFSPIALLICLPLISISIPLITSIYLYLLTYKFITLNWIELPTRWFILIIKYLSTWAHCSSLSPSIFLIIAIWLLLLRKNKFLILLMLLLHGNAANSPSVFYSGSYSL